MLNSRRFFWISIHWRDHRAPGRCGPERKGVSARKRVCVSAGTQCELLRKAAPRKCYVRPSALLAGVCAVNKCERKKRTAIAFGSHSAATGSYVRFCNASVYKPAH